MKKIIVGLALSAIAATGCGSNLATDQNPGNRSAISSVSPSATAKVKTMPYVSTQGQAAAARARAVAHAKAARHAQEVRAAQARARRHAAAKAYLAPKSARTYNPANPYYQGYVDPGTRAGRGPTSGELQSQWMAKEKETYAPDGTPNEPAHPEAKTSDQKWVVWERAHPGGDLGNVPAPPAPVNTNLGAW